MKTRKINRRSSADCYIVFPEEEHTIKHALEVAANRLNDDAKEFEKLAAHLRAGNSYPMFADGEPGAIAAERIAQQFKKQAAECRAVLNNMEESEEDEE